MHRTHARETRVYAERTHLACYKSLERRWKVAVLIWLSRNIEMEMTFKVNVVLTIIVALMVDRLKAGVISLGEDALPGQHTSFATSFMQFHGPVEGPEFPVKVPYILPHSEHNHIHHEDHGYTHDYIAHPKYEFSYGVEDYHTGDFHGQKETRDGSSVHGEYSVVEPGGNIRRVTYHADKDGFHAVVHNSGKNDHSGGVYGDHDAHSHVQIQGHASEAHHKHQSSQDYSEYATEQEY
ncbi:uncharacterized protein [Prorops nasuta]|uniref:uncharacterized protein n=1 Tax=Prorops nasuta TaxID=863751 RepID=UPI0034CF16B1